MAPRLSLRLTPSRAWSASWRPAIALAAAALVLVPAVARSGEAARGCNDFADPAAQVRACSLYIGAAHVDEANLASAYANRGIARNALHRKAEAYADFSEAIRLAPDWAGPYFNRANLLLEAHDWRAAIEDYTAAIERDDSIAYAYFNRARAYDAAGQRDQALTDFAQALALEPGLEAARRQLGVLRRQPDTRHPNRKTAAPEAAAAPPDPDERSSLGAGKATPKDGAARPAEAPD